MSTAKPRPSIYQLKITLLDIDPPIWRRIQVPATIPLRCLHDALQAVMGWTDSHLHQFERDGKYWGVPDDEGFDDIEVIDEGKVPLETLLRTAGDSMIYGLRFWGRLAAPSCTGKHPNYGHSDEAGLPCR